MIQAKVPLQNRLNGNRLNIPCRLLGFFILFLLVFPVVAQNSAGYFYDPDSSGIYRHYNTDSSKETDVQYDHTEANEFVYKMFYINQQEWSRCSKAHLWVYARCIGEKDENEVGWSHTIRARWGLGLNEFNTICNFECYELFKKDVFHWQMFEFEKGFLSQGKWNKIEIIDNSAWTVNNLAIGIDQDYGGTPDDRFAQLIDDFDTSCWSTNYDPNQIHTIPTQCDGELMIKLELIDDQDNQKFFPQMNQNGYWHNYYPYEQDINGFIPIDYSDDKIKWQVDLGQDDIADAGYARLYIYGYSWTVPDPGPDNYRLTLTVNNNIFPFYPQYLWAESRNIAHWNWLEVDIPSLKGGQTNTFYITKPADCDWKKGNLAIINFEDEDHEHSAYYWSTGGSYHGDYPQLRPDHCDGELGIFLLIYEKYPTSKKVGGFEIGCRLDGTTHGFSDSHIDLTHHVSDLIINGKTGQFGFNGLVDYNWQNEFTQDLDHITSPPKIYEESFHSVDAKYYTGLCGDRVDLLIVETHGEPWEIILQDGDIGSANGEAVDSGRDTTKDISITQYGYPETDYWGGWEAGENPYNVEYGEDGFNFQTDWILLLACEVLSGGVWDEVHQRWNWGTLDANSPLQFMMCHGLHILMGFVTNFGGDYSSMEDFAWRLVENLCDDEMTIIAGFEDAVYNMLDRYYGDDETPRNRIIIYYNIFNQDDTLDNTMLDFDMKYGYEAHNYVYCLKDDDGLS